MHSLSPVYQTPMCNTLLIEKCLISSLILSPFDVPSPGKVPHVANVYIYQTAHCYYMCQHNTHDLAIQRLTYNLT